VSGTHPVHNYRSQHLQLDGRIGEQYLVDRLALLSRTICPVENLHDFVDPFLPYSFLDTVVWLADVTSAGGMLMVL
jgi:hypothetical protein